MKVRYVCLPEYNCRCEPPGKPVALNTMKRHMKIANDARKLSGLPLLPRGPKYMQVAPAQWKPPQVESPSGRVGRHGERVASLPTHLVHQYHGVQQPVLESALHMHGREGGDALGIVEDDAASSSSVNYAGGGKCISGDDSGVCGGDFGARLSQ